MNSEALWNKIILGLSSEGEELQTTTGLWFRASAQGERLYIDNATKHTPSCNLFMQRSISKEDFLFVHSYYDCWMNG